MLQAYCSYAWPAIQHAVLARWEAEKKSETFDDGDDPLPDDGDDPPPSDDDAPLVGQNIPLSFKLQVAKKIFEDLPQATKDAIDNRRNKDHEKLYRTIPEIDDDWERIVKLRSHKRYCPSTDAQ